MKIFELLIVFFYKYFQLYKFSINIIPNYDRKDLTSQCDE